MRKRRVISVKDPEIEFFDYQSKKLGLDQMKILGL